MELYGLCETSSVLRTILIIKYFIRIIFVIIPIILIVPITINLFKCVISGKQEELRNLVPTIIKKSIAALLIFFVPTIVKFAFSLVSANFGYYEICYNNATIENIKYYEKLEPVRRALEDANANPSEKNIAKATELLESAKSYATGETIADYYALLGSAQNKADDQKNYQKCIDNGGLYQNGVCKERNNFGYDKPTTENNGNGSGSGTGSSSSGGLTDYSNAFNNDYKSVKTGMSLSDYASVVKKYNISQTNPDDTYRDYCLAFAYVHAYDLYTGTTTDRAKDAKAYKYATNFSAYTSDSKSDVLSKVYYELSNGRPCILQVNGNKQGTSRHYVTVVGIKKSVKNASTLKEEDLLILDSYDGNVERMDTASSRFMTTGKDCLKEYSGYQMFYIK